MSAQYLDIIVLLLVVFVIYQRLKSILGTKTNSFQKSEISKEEASKIFDIIMKEAQDQAIKEANINTASNAELTDIDATLEKIPNFDKQTFISGAKKAFEIILTAFSKGDIETLEMLVNKNLLKKFQEILEKRNSEGFEAEFDFIGFDKAEITNAKISKNNIAKITVEFISQQVNLLKNKNGEVIQGDEQYIQNINDSWTFEKTLDRKSVV